MSGIVTKLYGAIPGFIEVTIEEYFNKDKTVFIIKTVLDIKNPYVKTISLANVRLIENIEDAQQFSTYNEAKKKIESCVWTSLKNDASNR